jgi:Zinc finger, C3HC4 type (RING finger)
MEKMWECNICAEPIRAPTADKPCVSPAILMPCGHGDMCMNCASKIKREFSRCPLCQKSIQCIQKNYALETILEIPKLKPDGIIHISIAIQLGLVFSCVLMMFAAVEYRDCTLSHMRGEGHYGDHMRQCVHLSRPILAFEKAVYGLPYSKLPPTISGLRLDLDIAKNKNICWEKMLEFYINFTSEATKDLLYIERIKKNTLGFC